MRTWVNSRSSGASFSTALASLRLNESLRRLPTNTATLVLAMGTAPSREGVPRLSAPVRKWRVKDGRDCSARDAVPAQASVSARSEEHTSELQSLMRISYAVFCLKKKNNKNSRKLK